MKRKQRLSFSAISVDPAKSATHNVVVGNKEHKTPFVRKPFEKTERKKSWVLIIRKKRFSKQKNCIAVRISHTNAPICEK